MAAITRMKMLVMLVALCLYAQAQGTWTGKPYDVVVNVGGVATCSLSATGRVEALKGREQFCWEQVIQAHNEMMNDPKNHALLDRALQKFAEYLGKKLTYCARDDNDRLLIKHQRPQKAE